MARKYGPGEAWAYIENEDTDAFGSTVDTLLMGPTKYEYWDDFVDAAHAEAKRAGHRFPKHELGRDLWNTWFAEYRDGGEGDPALDRVYETWAEGRPLFSFGDERTWRD